jgi:hypothetical protein
MDIQIEISADSFSQTFSASGPQMIVTGLDGVYGDRTQMLNLRLAQ